MRKTEYKNSRCYKTKDGSEIRELMHPDLHSDSLGVKAQSLAEATVHPGQQTALHKHNKTEELYHITRGCGVMTLNNEEFNVEAGDTICIPAGTVHCIRNTGSEPLRFLCCCSPAYSHDDTDMLQKT